MAKQEKQTATVADLKQDELTDWGISFGNAKENYSRKIEIPTYEPTGENVPLSDLTDTVKYDDLRSEIEAAEIPEGVKAFLLLDAPPRHIVFDYARIDDYYANATPEIQDLMEKSALVIIDFNKAIEKGFVS